MSLFQKETLSKKLIKQWFWWYFFAFAVAPAGYVFRILLSHEFNVAEVGVFFSVVWLVTFLTTYNDFWLTNSLRYFLPQYWIARRFDAMKTSLFFSLCVQIFTAIVISGLLWLGWAERLGMYHFKNPLAAPLLRILALYFLCINLVEVLSTVLSAFQDVLREKLSYFVRMRWISLIALFLFFFWYKEISYYAWAWLGWLVLSLFYLLYVFFRFYAQCFLKGSISISSFNIKEYWKYALRSFLGINATALMTQIDQQMIVNMLWWYDAWIYTNYLSLLNAFTTLLLPLIAISFPIIVELFAKAEKEKMTLLANFLLNNYLLLAFAWAFFYLILWPRIATVFFGSQFFYSGVLLQYAAFSLPIILVSHIVSSLLSWIWSVDEYVKIVLFASILNFFLNLIGIRLFWLLGVVFATMFSWLLVCVWGYIKLLRTMNLRFDVRFLWKNLVLLLLTGIGLYYLLGLYQDNLFWGIIYWDLLVLGLIFFVFLLPLIFANRWKLCMLYNELIRFKS